MRRRASTAAGRISAEGIRTAAEGTPAVTAASIIAEVAGARLPVATKHRCNPCTIPDSDKGIATTIPR